MKHLCLLFFLLPAAGFAQGTGKLYGYVRDARTQQPVPGASVVLEGTTLGTATNEQGYYSLGNIPPRSYNVRASYVSYKTLTKFNVVLTSGNAAALDFDLEETASELGEVVVQASPFPKSIETPNSVQRLSETEIKSYPGGNNDVAKVVQSLPGVSGSVGFRNDVIIRGGAPNENVYYLDAVEVPIINHFATQGASGGPAGLINVSFIKDVTLTASGFPARYDNPLSGVLQFTQRTGNPERRQFNFRLSATEAAVTAEGPVVRKNPNTTFIASVRRSYLQLLFKAIGLPFLPSYWDYQYKVTHKVDDRNEINVVGVGSIDKLTLDPPTERKKDETQADFLGRLAILDGIPTNRQWTTTAGVNWKRLIRDGYFNLTLSKNVFSNGAEKYENDDPAQPARLRYRSVEDENKLRFDLSQSFGPWTVSYGAGAQYVQYRNETFNRITNAVLDGAGNEIAPAFTVDYRTALAFWRVGAFGQLSGSFLDDRLSASLGVRADGNTYTTGGLNPAETFSPRLAASYALTRGWNVNASLGRYYKLPPYTILGFRAPESGNGLVNRDAKYIRSDHAVAGLEFLPSTATRVTVEGFYKRYGNYPVSVRNGISLANLGGDFAVLGNEAIRSVGLGRSYGVEFLLQQKLTKNFYGILAYTLYRSRFSGEDRGRLVPSAWDNRHLVSFTGGYKFPRNWELGTRFRYQGGRPYTPVDSVATLRDYAATGATVLDYSQLNARRLSAFNALDVRLDKKWNFKGWFLNVFLEVQNLYNSADPEAPSYTLARDDNGTVIDPAQLYGLPPGDSTVVPTIGIIVEF